MDNSNNVVDPGADLAIISRAQRELALEDFLNFGPLWYAPALATLIGGLSMFGRDFNDNWSVLYGAAAVLAGLTMAVHDYRRRRVRPKFSLRSAMFVVVVIVICWVVSGLWGTAISTISYEDFVPTYAIVGWLLTTAFFLLVRASLGLARSRRGSVA